MASEIIASLGVFKTLFDTAKGLKDINDAAVRNAAVIELQEKILAAQAQHAALIERVGELEKEVARLETWEAEQQRYQLTDYGSGTFAYAVKPEARGTEPDHRLCASCYQKGHKSILQFDVRDEHQQDRYTCPACKTEFRFGTPQPREWAF